MSKYSISVNEHGKVLYEVEASSEDEAREKTEEWVEVWNDWDIDIVGVEEVEEGEVL